MPTPMEEYLFDLHGYTVIMGALDPDHLRAMNDFLDALPPLQIDQWYGNIDVHSYKGIDGTNLQNIIEGGAIFERLIDHPAWIDLVRHYIGPHDRPFINEGFINIREQGGYIGVHSGGHMPDSRNRTGRSQGEWCCCPADVNGAFDRCGCGRWTDGHSSRQPQVRFSAPDAEGDCGHLRRSRRNGCRHDGGISERGRCPVV